MSVQDEMRDLLSELEHNEPELVEKARLHDLTVRIDAHKACDAYLESIVAGLLKFRAQYFVLGKKTQIPEIVEMRAKILNMAERVFEDARSQSFSEDEGEAKLTDFGVICYAFNYDFRMRVVGPAKTLDGAKDVLDRILGWRVVELMKTRPMEAMPLAIAPITRDEFESRLRRIQQVNAEIAKRKVRQPFNMRLANEKKPRLLRLSFSDDEFFFVAQGGFAALVLKELRENLESEREERQKAWNAGDARIKAFKDATAVFRAEATASFSDVVLRRKCGTATTSGYYAPDKAKPKEGQQYTTQWVWDGATLQLCKVIPFGAEGVMDPFSEHQGRLSVPYPEGGAVEPLLQKLPYHFRRHLLFQLGEEGRALNGPAIFAQEEKESASSDSAYTPATRRFGQSEVYKGRKVASPAAHVEDHKSSKGGGRQQRVRKADSPNSQRYMQ